MRIITIAILAAVLLAACNTSTLKIRVHSGTEGVVMKMLDKAPPSTVYEGDYFPVVLQLDNKGAMDVVGGYYSLNIEDSAVELNERANMFDLHGRDETRTVGDSRQFQFSLKAKVLDPQVETYTTTIGASLCYPYRTEASATVCIDTDLLGAVKTKPCTAGSTSMSGGQGAPVSVSSIESRMLTHKDKNRIAPEFLITIQDSGPGLVVNKDKVLESCTSISVDAADFNVANVKAYLADQQLTCSSQTAGKDGRIKLVNKREQIRCNLPEGISISRGTYSTLLTVVIDYGYTQTIAKQVIIKKIG